jgi:hypothetical protein
MERPLARLIGIVLAIGLAPIPARTQQPPPIRPVGPITHVSLDSLTSVNSAVPTSGGRVYVNDLVARRVLLFDAALSKAIVVVDSAGASANAYDRRAGALLPYRADSALLVTPSSLSMLVLSPTGAITRTMAMPPSITGLVGAVGGTAGFDAQARMLYVMQVRSGNTPAIRPGETVMQFPDSAFVVRFDLVARTMDTIATLRTPKSKVTITRDEQDRLTSTMQVIYPVPVVDDWAVMPDGTIAVVRGRDYHVDWLSPGGLWTSTPKMPFAWEHLDDDQKRALIDSLTNAAQANFDSAQARSSARAAAAGGGAAGGGGRGGSGAASTPVRIVFARSEVSDVPDYRPPIRQGSTRADADGNLWIRTTVLVDKRPVYDIVNRRGEVTDRVQLPRFRLVAGFGPGVVYMSVLDSNKVAHLERAMAK